MEWIKRNLFFVIGSAVAVALLGGAGYYNYSQWSANAAQKEALAQKISELDQLSNQKPHPGNEKIDNIKEAKEQEKQARAVLEKAVACFQPINPIPRSDKEVKADEFAAALRRTIDQLERAAKDASVILPPKFSFSFSLQRSQLKFAAGSLQPLSVQLGEVKAICDVVMAAKVNALDSVRRERVSADDLGSALQPAPITDYLEQPSITNDLAIVSTYEITFRSFTPELAAVLSGFASSPYGLIVKGLNVEPAQGAGDLFAETNPDYPPAPTYAQPVPVYPQPVVPRAGLGEDEYGRYARPNYPTPGYPTYPTPAYPNYPTPTQPGVAVPGRGGLQTVLNEGPIKVTMQVSVVKFLPPQPQQ